MKLPSAVVAAVALVVVGCSALIPSEREMEYSSRRLQDTPGVAESRVWCNDDIAATSDLCASVRMNDGLELLFFGVGYRSFGDTADLVLVADVGGLKPFVAMCGDNGMRDSNGRPKASEAAAVAANFHQSGMFGDQVTPPLADVVDAVRRHRDLQSALEKWPRCPEYWSFENAGLSVRYCVNGSEPKTGRPPVDPTCGN